MQNHHSYQISEKATLEFSGKGNFISPVFVVSIVVVIILLIYVAGGFVIATSVATSATATLLFIHLQALS